MTFGLVKPGPSPAQQQDAQYEAMIRTRLHGNYKVGVLGKGGVGKTSVAASVGSLFAELRRQDHTVAIDADRALAGRNRGRRRHGSWRRTGRARRRRAGRRLQTVPQEFVALVHGLLGCQAIERRSGGLSGASDKRHGPTTDAGYGTSTGPVSPAWLGLPPCKLSSAYCTAAAPALAAP
ncbi:hypothetical protein [Mycobacterium scrofulaceum]|uniref:CobQ/CobB/MinD/ParA nucleotide binding domain-containing protein n=1 Tax=Mycobacterium scrofulaceum TaxID=1783 RepID=A0A1A2W5Y8_MYCSC|nr:hypothetical protein A5679_09630 [Mycobacterium scrofulaceum]